MASAHDKRREERIQLEIPVLLEKGHGTCRNMSNSGIYFVTDQPLSVGTEVRFSVNLAYAFPGRAMQLNCQGQVLRTETVADTGERFGIAASISECWCMH
jgi:hypothetical protein